MPTKIIPTGCYEAQLRRISLSRAEDISYGASVWFWIPTVKQAVKYYIKPAKEDLSFSLKQLTYFLDYPYGNGNHYNHHQLIGRYCQIKIESISSNGHQYPRINGFAFSDRQLFRGISDEE